MNDAPRPEHSPSPTPREHSIERLLSLLETFTEGSRDLDARIDIALRGHGHWRSDMPGWVVGHGEQPWQAPHYTTSLDAALTLVPEGQWWEIGRCAADDSAMRHFAGGDTHRAAVGKWGDPLRYRHSSTPALALCIAALKARSAK